MKKDHTMMTEKKGQVLDLPLTMERRSFLKKVAAGSLSAAVLMVYRPFSNAENEPSEDLVPVAEPEKKKPNYAYVIDTNKCIGAGDCVKACSTENDVPAGMFRTWVERYIITDEGVHVDSPNGSTEGFPKPTPKVEENSKRAYFVPKLCNQCRDAPCIQVCPVGATFQIEEGFVLMDYDHCIGCSACIQGCPYGVRFLNPDTGTADKCDWCYHRVKRGEQPACVTACPTGARAFGDLNDPESEVSKVFKKNNWMVLKPEMHTDSYVFYVELPREVV